MIVNPNFSIETKRRLYISVYGIFFYHARYFEKAIYTHVDIILIVLINHTVC